MPSPRDLFLKYFNITSKVVSTKWLLNITDQRSVLPFYHAISDQPLPHIDNLYRVKTVNEFESDLEFLLKHFEPVDFWQFKQIATAGRKGKKPVFLITFDDGLKEFHDIIAPILVKNGIPAVCFLNAAFIDNKDLFFKYKASLLVSHLRENEHLTGSPAVTEWKRENSVDDVTSWLLSVKYVDRHRLNDFAFAAGYNFNEYLKSVKPYLTTPQIERLIRDGFHFGAHSIDHPEYWLLPFSEQIRQTSESTDFVRKKFSLNYGLFSFPFSDYQVSDDFFKAVMSTGMVDLTFGCAGLKQDVHPFHIQRIAFEKGKLPAKEIYKTELIYTTLQGLIGRKSWKNAESGSL
jgi:peptidoglycan/xylan/chitin deacetylase (PgdA/CDA1 family)